MTVHEAAIIKIAADIHMREEPHILKDIADAPLIRGHVESAGAVINGFAANDDPAEKIRYKITETLKAPSNP